MRLKIIDGTMELTKQCGEAVFLDNEEKKDPQNEQESGLNMQWFAIGIAFGPVIGMFIGIFIDNLALGVALGMPAGILLGVILGAIDPKGEKNKNNSK